MREGTTGGATRSTESETTDQRAGCSAGLRAAGWSLFASSNRTTGAWSTPGAAWGVGSDPRAHTGPERVGAQRCPRMKLAAPGLLDIGDSSHVRGIWGAAHKRGKCTPSSSAWEEGHAGVSVGEAAFLPHKRDGALNATADIVAARLTETVITVSCQETPSTVWPLDPFLTATGI